MKHSSQIIIALDGMHEREALRIAKMMSGRVWGFKVNDLLYYDTTIIRRLKKFGHVFTDVKLYDIPNTISNSVRRLRSAGADMITVHASGGIEMMKAAKRNAGRSKIIAVTILTSLQSNSKEVMRLTRDALKAGVEGIVCSGADLQSLRSIPGTSSLLKVVPGIRPKWYKNRDDQKRTITPEEAIKLGADYLVIGRPITKAKNPMKAIANL